MTLTEFLLARIAEDEATIQLSLDRDLWHAGLDRQRREGGAKRQIVGLFADADKNAFVGATVYLASVLKHLAAVYADHPDYREEWKP